MRTNMTQMGASGLDCISREKLPKAMADLSKLVQTKRKGIRGETGDAGEGTAEFFQSPDPTAPLVERRHPSQAENEEDERIANLGAAEGTRPARIPRRLTQHSSSGSNPSILDAAAAYMRSAGLPRYV